MVYDVDAGKDLVSIDVILARCLWDQEKHHHAQN